MIIEPIRFGHSHREMLGMLTAPEQGAQNVAVLFCNPFGQEAIRSKPMYRTFADRMAREGVPSLRFDYHGTGDSPGSGDVQTMAAWVHDTIEAARTVVEVTGATQLHLFGLALGANIAARAALALTPAPVRLVLWEPIVDGAAYIDVMLQAHRKELSIAFGERWERIRIRLAEPEPTVPGVVLGFPIGEDLHEELCALALPDFAALTAQGTRIDCAARGQYESDVQAMHSVVWHPPGPVLNWMANEAHGTAIVPREVQTVLFNGLLRPESVLR